jgi:hypothetical protein
MLKRFIITILLLCAACAASKDVVLSKTFAGLNAARDAFVTWDERHQAEIVDAAKSLEEGKAALTSYRAKRTKVKVAFEVAYGAFAVASISGTADAIAKASTAATSLLSALRELGVLHGG